MKRKLFLLLVCCILICTNTVVFAQNEDGVVVSIPTLQAEPGEVIDVDVVLSGEADIWCANFCVEYDDELLTLERISSGNNVLQMVAQVPSGSPFTYYGEYSSITNNADFNGTLVTLSFRVHEEAAGQALDFVLQAPNADPFIAIDEKDILNVLTVPHQFVNGQVNVGGESAPQQTEQPAQPEADAPQASQAPAPSNTQDNAAAEANYPSVTELDRICEYRIKRNNIEIVRFTGNQASVVLKGYYMVDGKALPVAKICESAFENASITSVDIPETVEEIEDWAFYNCPLLAQVVIRNTDCKIGEKAFGYLYVDRENDEVNNGLTVYAPVGSRAHQYTKELEGVIFIGESNLNTDRVQLQIDWFDENDRLTVHVKSTQPQNITIEQTDVQVTDEREAQIQMPLQLEPNITETMICPVQEITIKFEGVN